MIKSKFSYKHVILFSTFLLFLITLSESILFFKVSKGNSEKITINQNIDTKVLKLNSISAKVTNYHNCISEGNSTDSFYECKLINYSNNDFSNWEITLLLKDDIDLKGSWNADVKTRDRKIIVKPLDKISNTIKSNTSFSFEIYVNYDSPILLDSIIITGNSTDYIYHYPLHIINVVLGAILILIMIIYSIVHHSVKNELSILNRITERSNTIIEQTMKTFVNFIDAKDEYTRGHSTRVAEYSRLIAKRMGYNKQFQQDIYYMGLMHDIGKITVPDSILNKTSHLTADEWAVIQMHTENGANLLKNFTVIPEIRDAVLYHHERYDGKGYLAQLKGEEIPLCARIICVADSFDAMNTNRCYRLKYSKDRIIKEFERCSAKQFDPTIASIMIELLSDGTIS